MRFRGGVVLCVGVVIVLAGCGKVGLSSQVAEPVPSVSASTSVISPGEFFSRSEDEIFAEAEKTATNLFNAMSHWEEAPSERLPDEVYRYTGESYTTAIENFHWVALEKGLVSPNSSQGITKVGKADPFIPEKGIARVVICRFPPEGFYSTNKDGEKIDAHGVAVDTVSMKWKDDRLVIVDGKYEGKDQCPLP